MIIDTSIPICPVCQQPAHAAESDDLDRHAHCAALEELRASRGRDLVDRAHELVMARAPELDGAEYIAAITAEIDELEELDDQADDGGPSDAELRRWERRQLGITY